MEHEGLDLQQPWVLQIPKISQYSDHLWQLVLYNFAHPQLILVQDGLCPPGSCPPTTCTYHLSF